MEIVFRMPRVGVHIVDIDLGFVAMSISRRFRTWCTWILWAVAGLLALRLVWTWSRDATPLGLPWQRSNGIMLDFRDIVVVPGRELLHGGNPYDPRIYLAHYPWAQEFDPYAPAWLLFALGICWLPLRVACIVYLTFTSVLMAWISVFIAKLAFPRRRSILAPILMLWMLTWYHTRVMGSSFILMCAVVVLCREVLDVRQSRPWLAGAALAVIMFKPQFGVPVLLFLILGRRFLTCCYGLFMASVASLPVAIMCVVSAGGIAGFVRSLNRDVSWASSPNSPTGSGVPDSIRTDAAGMLMRYGVSASSLIAYIVCAAVLLVTGCAIWRRGLSSELLGAAICATLIFPVHLDYDLSFMIPVAVCALFAVRRRSSGVQWGMLGFACLPILHLIGFSHLLNISVRATDAIDMACVIACWALAVAGGLRASVRMVPNTYFPRRAVA